MNQLNMLTHRCGQCNQIFKSDSDYLKHNCPAKSTLSEKSEESSSILKSEPPKISKKAGVTRISEDEILRAVIEARKAKRG